MYCQVKRCEVAWLRAPSREGSARPLSLWEALPEEECRTGLGRLSSPLGLQGFFALTLGAMWVASDYRKFWGVQDSKLRMAVESVPSLGSDLFCFSLAPHGGWHTWCPWLVAPSLQSLLP